MGKLELLDLPPVLLQLPAAELLIGQLGDNHVSLPLSKHQRERERVAGRIQEEAKAERVCVTGRIQMGEGTVLQEV